MSGWRLHSESSHLLHWVVVDINDPVQVSSDNLCDLKQLLEVVGPVRQDKPV